MTWIQNLETDAKGVVKDIENIQWVSDVHKLSTEVDTFAQHVSSILSGLPEHGPAMLAAQTIANLVANISAAVANGTVTAPAATVVATPATTTAATTAPVATAS